MFDIAFAGVGLARRRIVFVVQCGRMAVPWLSYERMIEDVNK